MKQINWKTFVIELIFFMVTLILGVMISPYVFEMMQSEAIYAAEGNQSQEAVSPLIFVAYFIFATLLVYLVSKSEKLKKQRLVFFKFAFFLSVAVGGFITLSVFLPELISFSVMVILLFIWEKKPIVFIHNLLIVFAIAGIGALVGTIFDPPTVVVFLILFSVYDVIAVYKTKHMVKMATEMIKTKAVMGLIAPLDFKSLFDDLSKKKKKEFMVLGGGDLAFPLFLATSVSHNYGFVEAMVVVSFACLGLFGSFFFFIIQKIKKPIPALPPIALLSIIGYLLARFVL